MNGKRTWLWITGGLLLLFILAVLLSSAQPKTYSDYLSTSPSPTGVKGLYSYMKQEETEVSRWQSEPHALPKLKEQGLLVMIQPYYTLTQKEQMEYQDWMESGGVIWLANQDPAGFFHVKTKPVLPGEGKTTLHNKDDRTFQAEVSSKVRLKPNKKDDILYSDKQGAVAVKQSVGKGALIVSLSPNWFTNGAILKNDHTALISSVMNTADADTILFDEYVHGNSHIPSLFTLYPKWMLVFILQAIAITILWLWMKGKRFGPVVTPREETVRFGDERLQALAAWYVKGGFYKESLSIQEEYVRKLMHDRWGISVNMDWEDVRSYMEQKFPNEEFRTWKHRIEKVISLKKENHVTKNEYLDVSRLLDEIQKEVQTS